MKLILLLALFPLTAFSQATDISYLVVKGRAEVQVPVEYLEISLGINTYGSSLRVANDSNRTIVLKALEILRRFAVPDSDFQTMNNSSNEDLYNKDVERRFAVHYIGLLYLRHPSSYDSLFQSMVSLGNVTMSINAFRSNRHIYFRMLAYHKAVEAAKREAEMLLKGSHQKVGKIIKLIQDNRDLFTQYDNIDNLLGQAAQPSSNRLAGVSVATQVEGTNPTTFRKKSFSEVAEVTVIFAIK